MRDQRSPALTTSRPASRATHRRPAAWAGLLGALLLMAAMAGAVTHSGAPSAPARPATATAAAYQHIANAACTYLSAGPTAEAVWQPATGMVAVTIALPQPRDGAGALAIVQTDVYHCFAGFYATPAGVGQGRSGVTPPPAVTIHLTGPARDAAGHAITATYGSATLTRATAARLAWATLDAQAAWAGHVYDAQAFAADVRPTNAAPPPHAIPG